MSHSFQIGDIITLGSYVQNDVLPEPIRWIALDIIDSKALLLSQRVLDGENYHNENIEITWKDSDIRKWCNNDFFDSAFTERDQKIILSSFIDNQDAYEVTVPGEIYHPYPDIPEIVLHKSVPSRIVSVDTTDKVFLLSVQECLRYKELLSLSFSLPALTRYAKQRGVLPTPCDYVELNGSIYEQKTVDLCAYWWLRTRATFGSHASVCYAAGNVAPAGSMVYLGEKCGVGVRPAIWIDLNVY
jgi:hypothetical protein